MKMERLIGILSILLQRERVTAPELAEQLKCPAGPFSETSSPCAGRASLSPPPRARGGGISIMEGVQGGPHRAHCPGDAGHPGGASGAWTASAAAAVTPS